MNVNAGWKIKAILKKKHMKMAELAELLGCSRQNLSNKFAKDNFSEKELYLIASLLNCTAEVVFTDNEDNQKF